MSASEVMNWADIGELIQGVKLSPKAIKNRDEIVALLNEQSENELQENDAAVLLLIMGESLLKPEV